MHHFERNMVPPWHKKPDLCHSGTKIGEFWTAQRKRVQYYMNPTVDKHQLRQIRPPELPLCWSGRLSPKGRPPSRRCWYWSLIWFYQPIVPLIQNSETHPRKLLLQLLFTQRATITGFYFWSPIRQNGIAFPDDDSFLSHVHISIDNCPKNSVHS